MNPPSQARDGASHARAMAAGGFSARFGTGRIRKRMNRFGYGP